MKGECPSKEVPSAQQAPAVEAPCAAAASDCAQGQMKAPEACAPAKDACQQAQVPAKDACQQAPVPAKDCGWVADKTQMQAVGCKTIDVQQVCVQQVPLFFQHVGMDRGSMKILNSHYGLKKDSCNWRIEGVHKAYMLGHEHFTHNDRRALDWKNTSFTNFSLEHIEGGSMNAHGSNWNNFYINSRSLFDWKFKNATLSNGWFNAKLKGAVFSKTTLNNVQFFGSVFTRTHHMSKGLKITRFQNAILNDCHFEGSRLKHVKFKNTTFNTTTSFMNVQVNFTRQFVGSFIQDGTQKYQITPQLAQKLDGQYHTWDASRMQSFSMADILQKIK